MYAAKQPEPGGKAQLTLDLSNLPRGPLDVSKVPPGAEVVIRLRIADRLFEPCAARACLRLASDGK